MPFNKNEHDVKGADGGGGGGHHEKYEPNTYPQSVYPFSKCIHTIAIKLLTDECITHQHYLQAKR